MSSSPIGSHSCGHSDEAGVECEVNSTVNCTYGDVRLVGGSTQYEGRLEVCINGVWGTVCDDSWGSSDATVVCKQLGYAYTGYGIAKLNSHYGAGSGEIWLDDVACTSSNTKLLQCSSSPIGSHSCGHSDEAGVECEAPCTNGDLRLVGGNVEQEGRVEICIGNIWGTVCDDYWGNTDAQVVCGKLGYLKTDAIAFANAKFGAGIGSVYLDDVQCSGSETSLLSCTYDSNTADCTHSSDAGVRCQAPCTNGDLRLVGGNVEQEGRVEICIGNIWGTVCDDYWGNTDAQVVCGKLGYLKTDGIAKLNSHYGAGSGEIWLDDVACTSSNTKLLQCSSSPIGSHSCGHSDEAGVECEAPCTNGDLRLVGGNVEQEGRVEICIGNIWGTVCDDYWGNTDAQVVCGKLGYLKTAPCTNGDLRLVGGNVDQEGRVEICIGNIWGTVCDDYWGNTDAQVVCGKLGYLKTVNSTVNCTYGDVRLLGGSTQYEGRLEVCINGVWGTVVATVKMLELDVNVR
ncbi:deleted in malignant brain tumors 1 protein-like [Gigantopelta aegis]|uniref:deleted in malignant brain tumors 1 protein-like n=1 Tax=Gigantopelta aegis TaxID=1735272 RepID=UPI001B88E01D|nr:deleted in malignant brain tumors 1 protein-like [Gigantopelta aegis]